MGLIEEAVGSITDLRAALDAADASVHLFVYAAPSKTRKGREDCWRRVSLSGELSSSFIGGIESSFAAVEDATAEGSMSEFDYDVMADGHVGVYKIEEGSLREWLEAVPGLDWPHLFQIEDAEFVGKIRYMVSVVSFSDGRSVKCYRGRRGFEVVLTKPGKIAAFFSPREHELKAVDGPILTIDQQVDFFCWDETVYICNFPAFETITNIREVTRKKADACLQALGERFLLPDMSALRDAVGKKTVLAKKLAAAARHGLISDIDGKAAILRIMTKGLDITCVEVGDTFRFDFDVANGNQVRQFIELVTDSYLHSPTTGREYYATVKRLA